MELTVNGSAWESGESATVADVVEQWSATTRGVAVARNREVVPRSEWSRTALAPGDAIEIVSAAAGG